MQKAIVASASGKSMRERRCSRNTGTVEPARFLTAMSTAYDHDDCSEDEAVLSNDHEDVWELHHML